MPLLPQVVLGSCVLAALVSMILSSYVQVTVSVCAQLERV